jgi:hypothetical protein
MARSSCCSCCRFAQGIVDREDVSETFLKSLPSATDRYDVVYPVSSWRSHEGADTMVIAHAFVEDPGLMLQGNLPERLVRRRLRLFLRQQEYFNRCRLVGSCRKSLLDIRVMVYGPTTNITLCACRSPGRLQLCPWCR